MSIQLGIAEKEIQNKTKINQKHACIYILHTLKLKLKLQMSIQLGHTEKEIKTKTKTNQKHALYIYCIH